MSSTATGHGAGKLILFGEHSVVYGKPAIATGLPRGVDAAVTFGEPEDGSRLHMVDGDSGEVYLDVDPFGAEDRASEAFRAILTAFELEHRTVEAEVTFEVPIGVGLGSSAAFATAVARALAELVDDDAPIEDAVTAGEDVFHGTASGIDQAAALSGELFFYFNSDARERAIIEAPTFTIAVCRAGPAASTSEMVGRVRSLMDREPGLIEYVHMLVGDIARRASDALEKGDWKHVGELMDMNHGALCTLGVSTAELDAACHAARDAGALGAKLTGAGGGGCVFALTPDGADGVLEAWRARDWDCFSVIIGGAAQAQE